MKLSLIPFLLSAIGMLTANCGDGSPSSPSNIAQPLVTSVSVTCPQFGESSQCAAFAVFGDDRGQDVTGLASWTTSDPAIATVNSTGVVTARETGEVAIRANYHGTSGFHTVWAVPNQGLYGTSRTLSGMVLSMVGALPGVVLQILDGPNQGRTTTTSSDGRFIMTDLQDGPFTIRLSKSGFVTVEYVFSIPQGSDRTVTMSVSPG